MLHLLDEGLENFLRATVPLPARQVDVAFEAPDADWGAGVTKPTVNLYLWDVRRNQTERESGMELVHDEDGTMKRRQPPLRVDCRYLVTAWTSEVADEHRLLGAVLAALLQYPVVTDEHLPTSYREILPLPTLEVASPNGKETADIWSALGGQLKPGLDLRVTATLDFVLASDAGPAVERYEWAAADTNSFRSACEDPICSVAGPTADPGFGSHQRAALPKRTPKTVLVRAEDGDEVAVEGEKPASGKVPTTGEVEFEGRGDTAEKWVRWENFTGSSWETSGSAGSVRKARIYGSPSVRIHAESGWAGHNPGRAGGISRHRESPSPFGAQQTVAPIERHLSLSWPKLMNQQLESGGGPFVAGDPPASTSAGTSSPSSISDSVTCGASLRSSASATRPPLLESFA